MAETDWIFELVGENFLAIYDVVVDIHKERQLVGDTVRIPYFQDVVKFQELLPADTSNLRDRYCELRWKAIKLLESHDAVTSVQFHEGDHRWDSIIELTAREPAFTEIVTAVEREMSLTEQPQPGEARTSSENTPQTSSGSAILSLPDKVSLRWLAIHVPVSFWFWLCGTYLIVFGIGVKLGDYTILRRLVGEQPLQLTPIMKPAEATFLPGDLDLPFPSEGSRSTAARVPIATSAENGPITLTRRAAIIKQEFNGDRIAMEGITPTAEIISVYPDRPIVPPGSESVKLNIEFRHSSIIALGASAASMQPGERVRVGTVVVRIFYGANAQIRFSDVEIPVYLIKKEGA